MRIVSYNVNGLRARLQSPPRTLSAFLDSLDADIICLQETRMARHGMTAHIAVAEGYESFFSCTRILKRGRIGYSGVATFCRVGKVPSSTSPILPLAADEGFTGLLHSSQTGEIEGGKGRVGCYGEVGKTELSMQELLHLDSEGRCLITDHGAFGLFSFLPPNKYSFQALQSYYAPRQCFSISIAHGWSAETQRMEFKMNFFQTLQRRWDALLKNHRRIIAVGDFNVSPYTIDSCDPGPNFDQNIFRKWLRSLLRNEGGPFWDVFRFIHQDRKEAYTYWSPASGAEDFNFGSRIDLILAAGCCNHEIIGGSRGGETSHGFVECEVQGSDILSKFKHMWPDTHPRCQGGRSLKLEGSDHAPIFVHLREQRPVEPHDVPSLAARFMPEIRGRQQNLVSLLKRQPPPNDLRDAQSKTKLSRLESALEATELPTASGRCFWSGETASSFSMKRKPPSKLVGKSRKSQGSLSSAVSTKKQGMRISQKSDSQQKDLRTFFVSPSVKKESLWFSEDSNEDSNEADLTLYSNIYQVLNITDADAGREQSLAENLDCVDLSVGGNWSNGIAEDVQETAPDMDVLGIDEFSQIEKMVANDSEGQCPSQSQTESDPMRLEDIDTEQSGGLEQISGAEGERTANVASMWTRIKEKMARAVPLCQGHDEPCVARVVKKTGPNIGRGFYVCARAEGPSSNPEARCDHFEWASSFKKGGKPLYQKRDSEQPRSFLKRIF